MSTGLDQTALRRFEMQSDNNRIMDEVGSATATCRAENVMLERAFSGSSECGQFCE